MGKSEYNIDVFYVSPGGYQDVAKPGEGISAAGKDEIDLELKRSSKEEVKRCLEKHWNNEDSSPLLSTYENEDHAYEIASQFLREGNTVTIVVIHLANIAGKGFTWRKARPLIESLGLKILPGKIYRYSESERLFLHHIPDAAITEARQLTQAIYS
ncbi:hypothetical protein MY8738_003389 [Beauveria namnaoensis]